MMRRVSTYRRTGGNPMGGRCRAGNIRIGQSADRQETRAKAGDACTSKIMTAPLRSTVDSFASDDSTAMRMRHTDHVGRAPFASAGEDGAAQVERVSRSFNATPTQVTKS